MSRENVEIVRRIYDAFAQQDDVTPFEIYSPDIEWCFDSAAVGVDLKSVYRGHEGVREFWREWFAAFASSFEVEELRDSGDSVLAILREREVAKTTGLTLERPLCAVWEMRGGKAVRMRLFLDCRDGTSRRPTKGAEHEGRADHPGAGGRRHALAGHRRGRPTSRGTCRPGIDNQRSKLAKLRNLASASACPPRSSGPRARTPFVGSRNRTPTRRRARPS